MVANPTHLDFSIGFWHPFGPHGRESADSILARKEREITANGWTLWSFQDRQPSYALWAEEIRKRPGSVVVWCSAGQGAKDPSGQPVTAGAFRFHGDRDWKEVPSGISVPHPFVRNEGSAFVVERVLRLPPDYEQPTADWLRKDGTWQGSAVPTRPEYLVRPGQGPRLRRSVAALVLRWPYLATVRAVPPP